MEVNYCNLAKEWQQSKKRKVTDLDIFYCIKCGWGYMCGSRHSCTETMNIQCECGVIVERKTISRKVRCYPCLVSLLKSGYARKTIRKKPKTQEAYNVISVSVRKFPREICDCGKPTNKHRRYCSHTCQTLASRGTMYTPSGKIIRPPKGANLEVKVTSDPLV